MFVRLISLDIRALRNPKFPAKKKKKTHPPPFVCERLHRSSLNNVRKTSGSISRKRREHFRFCAEKARIDCKYPVGLNLNITNISFVFRNILIYWRYFQYYIYILALPHCQRFDTDWSYAVSPDIRAKKSTDMLRRICLGVPGTGSRLAQKTKQNKIVSSYGNA